MHLLVINYYTKLEIDSNYYTYTVDELRDSNIVLKIISGLPIIADRLSRIRAATFEDELKLLVSKHITQGWYIGRY